MTEKEKDKTEKHHPGSLANVSSAQNLPSTNLLEDALRELSPDRRQELMAKASEEALRLQAKTAEISIDEAAAQQETRAHVEAFNTLDKSKITMGHKLTSEFRTGVGTRKIESKSGATCFVVTAACGDVNHDLVTFYREFRDRLLTRKPRGRAFIAWYYRRGPSLASHLLGHPGRRLIVRLILQALKLPCRGVLWLSQKRCEAKPKERPKLTSR